MKLPLDKLTLTQRAFVLGVDPKPEQLRDYAIGLLFLGGFCVGAAAVITQAIIPGYLPPWAFNLGKFFGWFVVVWSVPVAAFMVFDFCGMLFCEAAIEHADGREEIQKATGKLREWLTSSIRAHLPSNLYWRVSKVISRLAWATLLIGLIMLGYTALPICMAVAFAGVWFCNAMHCGAVVKSLEELFPEADDMPQASSAAPTHTANGHPNVPKTEAAT